MTLGEIQDLVKEKSEGEVVEATRLSWNKDFLEFWIKVKCGVYIISGLDVALGATKSVGDISVYTTEHCMCKCKDGTEVKDAFELDEEDLEASDWVLI